jgi:hypothetical protein
MCIMVLFEPYELHCISACFLQEITFILYRVYINLYIHICVDGGEAGK